MAICVVTGSDVCSLLEAMVGCVLGTCRLRDLYLQWIAKSPQTVPNCRRWISPEVHNREFVSWGPSDPAKQRGRVSGSILPTGVVGVGGTPTLKSVEEISYEHCRKMMGKARDYFDTCGVP